MALQVHGVYLGAEPRPGYVACVPRVSEVTRAGLCKVHESRSRVTYASEKGAMSAPPAWHKESRALAQLTPGPGSHQSMTRMTGDACTSSWNAILSPESCFLGL
jgi:hypothetical protein